MKDKETSWANGEINGVLQAIDDVAGEVGDFKVLYDPKIQVPLKTNVTEKQEGVKHDQGKPDLSLIPPEAINALGANLTAACTAANAKYDRHNWRKGMEWHRPYAALQRHLQAWWAGDSIDPEYGQSHLWHALSNLAFLTTYEQRGIGTDDRYVPEQRQEVGTPAAEQPVQDRRVCKCGLRNSKRDV